MFSSRVLGQGRFFHHDFLFESTQNQGLGVRVGLHCKSWILSWMLRLGLGSGSGSGVEIVS
ncbi:hypothetical protein KY290_001710 [Solanum tuberosum]|uniref:Uncharacterized protein n=1 Tax=Solanum tuberosum TaxID=4113 RepID=A0ABQ7WMX7_SOLTU|nr:hypothetical protein KY284_001748 [Solanum tuberosum]KAH0782112.1 hypothetical protein KY290_001710 [Solanum tuberosum]